MQNERARELQTPLSPRQCQVGRKKGDPRGNLAGLNSRLARGTALNIVYQQELEHALRVGMDRKSKAGGDV